MPRRRPADSGREHEALLRACEQVAGPVTSGLRQTVKKPLAAGLWSGMAEGLRSGCLVLRARLTEWGGLMHSIAKVVQAPQGDHNHLEQKELTTKGSK